MTNNEPRKLSAFLPGARDATPPPTLTQPGPELPQAKINGVVKARWEACTFDSFDTSRNPEMVAAFERCKAVAAGEAWCALLAGGFGTGKTHLAIAAMHEFSGGNKSYFWKTPDFLEWVRVTAYD